VFLDVPMSRSDTGRVQLEALQGRFGSVSCASRLRDVDHWSDALEVAGLVSPSSCFARRLHGVVESVERREAVRA
jgi:hypothetical protein